MFFQLTFQENEKVVSKSLVPNTLKSVHKFALVLHLIHHNLLVIVCFYCYGYPTFHDTEQPTMCRCAVKKLITHTELVEWPLKLHSIICTFFSKLKKRDPLCVLSCCTGFLEHCQQTIS